MEQCNAMVKSGELFGTTEYATLQTRWRMSLYRYKRVRMYFILYTFVTVTVAGLQGHSPRLHG